jgi:hypothetical protein
LFGVGALVVLPPKGEEKKKKKKERARDALMIPIPLHPPSFLKTKASNFTSRF